MKIVFSLLIRHRELLEGFLCPITVLDSMIYTDISLQLKNLPAVQETQTTRVRSLGQEDPLEKEMTTLSSILAWEMPWTVESSGLQSMGSQKSLI